ncbi:MAG: DUF5056 domain-containing protein [Prevotella sp.]|nr:DUF5056 domain-containing protein [Prevotella sp.]
MMEDNERLLQQFFSEAAQDQIADNGFTERVMQQLAQQQQLAHQSSHSTAPSRLTVWFTRLWTPFCIAVFVVLFVVFRGWETLAVQLEVMLRTIAVQPFSINLTMLFSVVFGLLFVGVGEILTSQRRLL